MNTHLHTPTVSIIIDNYNYDIFLKDAIDSALNQTYERVEIIVVDDGSTDLSRIVIESYADRVQAIFKANGGQASAFNAGFAACHGDVVIFLDSDDVLLPHTAQMAADAFMREPALSKLMYRMEVVDAAGRKTGAVKPLPHAPLRVGDLRRQTLIGSGDTVWLPTSGNAFSAGVLQKIMPIPEQPFRKCGDFYLCHVSVLYGDVRFLNSVGAYYRVHGANSYELSEGELDLNHVRAAIHNWHVTQQELYKHARALQLKDCPRSVSDLTSVSDTGTKLLSLRMDSAQHPIAGDTRLGLLLKGSKAIVRRPSISLLMRLIFAGWFIAMAFMPRMTVPWLAQMWLLPSKRVGVVNNILGVLQRQRPRTKEAPNAHA